MVPARTFRTRAYVAATVVALAVALSPTLAFASGHGALGFLVMVIPMAVAFQLGQLGVGLLVVRKTERRAFVAVFAGCVIAAYLTSGWFRGTLAWTLLMAPVPFAVWDRGSKLGALATFAVLWAAGWLFARMALVALSRAGLLYWPVLLLPLVPLAVALASSGHRRLAVALLPTYAALTVAWTMYAMR